MPASVFAALHSRAPLPAQSAIQFWLDRESSYKRLSQLALDLVASPASQAYVERLFSLCGDLTARKRIRAKPEWLCFFVILATHAVSAANRLKWRWGRVLSWKIPEFCSVGWARSKTVFFEFWGCPSTILRTAYRKQFYPKPMAPMESRDSEGVLIASLESLRPGIWQI